MKTIESENDRITTILKRGGWNHERATEKVIANIEFVDRCYPEATVREKANIIASLTD